MSLIIKNKIGNVLTGTPTISDKYDVITAIVGDKMVKAGQIVAFDEVFKDNGKSVVTEPTGTDKYVGVVMHQNIHLEDKSKEPQEFLPGEVIGVCIKGFVTALAKKDFDMSSPIKVKDGLIDESGTVTVNNIKLTGFQEKKTDYSIVEVEVQ